MANLIELVAWQIGEICLPGIFVPLNILLVLAHVSLLKMTLDVIRASRHTVQRALFKRFSI